MAHGGFQMVLVLGDLIADLAIHIPDFPIQAQDLKPISYLEIGPGGATNIAIMASRFGLPVACMGEVGRDSFGDAVLKGLEREGIDTGNVILTAESKTPVAGVVVDNHREPAYLGYMGNLVIRTLPDAWREPLEKAEALFADGWVEIPEMPPMILEAFRIARRAGVKTFFDPGPGNPAHDLDWHVRAASLTTVLLVNEQEAQRLAQLQDPIAAAHFLVNNGSELVVLKRGAEGMILFTKDRQSRSPGFSVEPVDFTGAGDSVTGAMLYGYLNGFHLDALGALGNATGAAKVQKRGTGHNMPTPDEIRATLRKFAPERANLI
jgi:sugar/nucleoside kinase (ribokinase family)